MSLCQGSGVRVTAQVTGEAGGLASGVRVAWVRVSVQGNQSEFLCMLKQEHRNPLSSHVV